VIGAALWFGGQYGDELPAKVAGMIGFGDAAEKAPNQQSTERTAVLSEGGIVPEGTVRPR
ncbi:MAG: hypothetical protein ACK6D4_11310, partial [Planctomyces sp.]